MDAKSVFVRAGHVQRTRGGHRAGDAIWARCATLGIRLIVAKTPEAKGRVERVHGTNQDRLVKKLRRAGIATYADANQYLAATYWSAHNTRFAVTPLEPADFHLPIDPRLDLAPAGVRRSPSTSHAKRHGPSHHPRARNNRRAPNRHLTSTGTFLLNKERGHFY